MRRGLLAAAQLLRRSGGAQGACSELCAASGLALAVAASWPGGGGSGGLAGGLPWGLSPQVPLHSSAAVQAAKAASSSKVSFKPATPATKRGRPPSPVPDVDAEQLLRSLGLSSAANPAALLCNLRKLAGVRQQGVLDSAAAVAAHLRSPAVGLSQQQVGQLLEQCPVLFSYPPEQRAAVLFGELLAAGLTAAEAARCFVTRPVAAGTTTFSPGLAELAAILAYSEDRDSMGGPVAKVPAAQRTAAALLSKTPRAVQLVCQSAGYLQQRAAELQQLGLTAAEVAALVWDRPELLWTDAAARVASRAAVLQQELGLPAAEVVALVAKRKPSWLSSSVDTLRERAAALAEGFGQGAAAAIVARNERALNCDPAVWWRNLCYMAACGAADPKAVLQQCPDLHYNHAAPDFLQRRLLLQRVAHLTAAQLYEQHPSWLRHRKVPDLAQQLQFVQHRGQDMQRLLCRVLHDPLAKFLAAVGASQAEWEAWAAAHPPEACPLYSWAQQAAAEEAARLAAVLPPELAQRQRPANPRRRRQQT